MNKLFAIILVAAAGCAADDGSSMTIDPTPLAGTVGGQPWTFVAGDTDAFLSEGEDDFFAVLYPTAFTACGFSQPGGSHLIVNIPKTPGEYPMSLSQNMTFVVGDSNNLIATQGKIVVDSVTATKITGGLVSSFDGQNEVSGKFELTICAD